MNKVILMGRLTRDPELKFTGNGTAVANFTIAVNRRFKKDGQPEADFINCVAWAKPAENIANMVGKGCRVEICGRWETRNYEGNDGRKVYVNECVVEESTFIDFKDSNGGQSASNNQSNINTSNSNQNANNGRNGGYTRIADDPFNGSGQIDISDDDLPF